MTPPPLDRATVKLTKKCALYLGKAQTRLGTRSLLKGADPSTVTEIMQMYKEIIYCLADSSRKPLKKEGDKQRWERFLRFMGENDPDGKRNVAHKGARSSVMDGVKGLFGMANGSSRRNVRLLLYVGKIHGGKAQAMLAVSSSLILQP
jgi:hypothetical protein